MHLDTRLLFQFAIRISTYASHSPMRYNFRNWEYVWIFLQKYSTKALYSNIFRSTNNCYQLHPLYREKHYTKKNASTVQRETLHQETPRRSWNNSHLKISCILAITLGIRSHRRRNFYHEKFYGCGIDAVNFAAGYIVVRTFITRKSSA